MGPCALAGDLRAALDDGTGGIRPELAPFFEGFRRMLNPLVALVVLQGLAHAEDCRGGPPPAAASSAAGTDHSVATAQMSATACPDSPAADLVTALPRPSETLTAQLLGLVVVLAAAAQAWGRRWARPPTAGCRDSSCAPPVSGAELLLEVFVSRT